MDIGELLLDLINHQSAESPPQAAPGEAAFLLFLSITGVVVVSLIANSILHFVKEKISRASNERDLVVKKIRPVADSANDLLAKINRILVHCDKTIVDEIHNFRKEMANNSFASRFSTVEIDKYPSLKSVSFRLVQFFVESRRFQQHTDEIAEDSLLKDIFFYLHDKIPVAVRANIYRAGKFGLKATFTENLAAAADSLDAKEYRALSIRTFDQLIKKNIIYETDIKTIYNFLAFDANKARENIRNSNFEDCNHFASLCHFAILLIDFVQLAQNTPRWEEYRIYYIAFLKNHRRRIGSRHYIYRQNRDLNDGASYYETYWRSVFANYALSGRNWMVFQILRLWRWTRPVRCFWRYRDEGWSYRKAVKRALKRRGKIFGERHDVHEFTDNQMAVIAPSYKIEFVYNDNMEQIYNQLLRLLDEAGFEIRR